MRFIIFLLHGLVSILLTQTWFVADEYWQATEIAHYLIFNYGYQTWEWQKGIRSAAYPFVISTIYWILQAVSLDFPLLLIYIPRLMQVLLSSVSYVFLCDLASKFYGRTAANWTALCICSSWVLFYCMNRTLYNATETALIIIGIDLFPWKTKQISLYQSSKFIAMVALSTLFRPTSLVIWVPLCIYHLILAQKTCDLIKTMLLYICLGIVAISIQVAIDCIYYQRILFSPYLFFSFNYLTNVSAYYGTNPWYWYLTHGIPALFTTHILPLAIAVYKKPMQPLILLQIWIIIIYSFNDHKEFRFLLPIVPLGMCVIGGYFAEQRKILTFWGSQKMMVVLLFVTNIPIALYFGMIHLRGSIDVMSYLRSEVQNEKNMSVMFLMPCHSTPFYGHIHKNISLDFITCEPNLRAESDYKDETDYFYLNPLTWVEEKFNADKKLLRDSHLVPTHVVMFDSLSPKIMPFLNRSNFTLRAEFFYTHFPQGQQSKMIQVWSNKS